MNHNRLLPWFETYTSYDEISNFFIKYFGVDSPHFTLMENNIVQISDPNTGKIFHNYLCIIYNKDTFLSLLQKQCCLIVNEDLHSGKSIICAIDFSDYDSDVKDILFEKALQLIDAKRE